MGRAIGLSVILLGAAPAFAEGGRWYMSGQVERRAETLETATRYLRKGFPQLEIGETAPTPVKGIVMVKVGGDYVYLTEDGRHAIVGSLIDLESGANLSEDGKARDTQAVLAKFPDADRVLYPAQGQELARLTVFTDTSCGYCRKLHQEVQTLQRAGVRVTYIPFPRSGPTGSIFVVVERLVATMVKHLPSRNLLGPMDSGAS